MTRAISEAIVGGRPVGAKFLNDLKLAVAVAIGKAAAAGWVDEVNFKFTEEIGAVAEMMARTLA